MFIVITFINNSLKYRTPFWLLSLLRASWGTHAFGWCDS